MPSDTIQSDGPQLVDQQRLIPIALATLRPMACLSFDLFVLGESGHAPALYRQRDYPLLQDDLDRLAESEIRSLFITELGQLRYQQYLEEHLDEFLADEATPLEVRCGYLHDAGQAMLDSAMRIMDVGRSIEVAEQVGGQVANLVNGSGLLPNEMFRMLRHDYRLFTHVINVSAYCVLLAQRLGVTDQQKLKEIAVAGLLHDVGLRKIPRVLVDREDICKPEQREALQRHPQLGFQELRRRDELNWDQLMMVYQHHERCDGTGYPVGITDKEIHWLARLCAVVDTFDLASRPRKNRKPLHLCDIVEILQQGAGRQFDEEMVRCWIIEADRTR